MYEKIPSNSIRYFKSELNNEPSDGNLYGLALAYQNNNNYADALLLIDKLINKYPKNLFLNTTKIEILTKSGKFNEALELANKFLEISPKNFPLSISKSKLLLDMKRYFESEEIIRDQLIRRNDDPELWLLLSNIQKASKNIIGYYQNTLFC